MEPSIEKDNQFALKFKPIHAQMLYSHCAIGKTASSFRIEGITRITIWNWLRSEKFKIEEMVEAELEGTAAWLDFLEGLKYYKMTGIVTEEMKKKGITKIDGEMLRFELKTRFRQEYAEKSEVVHSGSVAKTIIYEEVETGHEPIKS